MNWHIRAALAVVLLTTLGACTSKYAVDSFHAPASQLNRDASFYVMLPRDGQYGSKVYPGSGAATAQAVVGALTMQNAKVLQASSVEDLATAQRNAMAAGAQYIFETSILNWEDRATEWSGRPDRITLKMVVHEVAAGKVVASTVARASSKWATFGGDHPQDLLPAPTKEFVGRLF